ncbi:MAG: Mov34/MPN/PAD-1 family protein [Candidatus Paceibacterota bacterium]
MAFKKFLEKLFSLDRLKFSEIMIKKDVVLSICEFARASYPDEFLAFLEGEAKNNVLSIYGLIYQPFAKSRRSASANLNMPILSNHVGSVHSHPARNSSPSRTDLASFGKRGAVHAIISYPYRPQDIRCYDFNGNPVRFGIAE